MNSVNDIWEKIIEILSGQLTPTAISTWFSDCTPIELDDAKLVIATTNNFKRDIIQKRFGETIKNVLSDIFACDFDLIVLTPDEIPDYGICDKSDY